MHEGVIQFDLAHEESCLRRGEREAAASLLGWRDILRDLGLLGATPGRYGGLGFGNVSSRCGARSSPRGRRPFVVSGTQTSGRDVDLEDFAVVQSWRIADFAVRSRGLVKPSSESLTHATIYDQAPHVGCVLHVHSPVIWRRWHDLRLPATPESVDYGTPQMARATGQLFRAGRVWETGVFVMRGHEDGVVAFGRVPDEAGARLIQVEAAARRPS